MKRFPEAVTTNLSGDFSQVALLIDSCRKLQGFEEEFKMALNNFLISKSLPPNIPDEAQTGVNWYFNPSEICYANE